MVSMKLLDSIGSIFNLMIDEYLVEVRKDKLGRFLHFFFCRLWFSYIVIQAVSKNQHFQFWSKAMILIRILQISHTMFSSLIELILTKVSNGCYAAASEIRSAVRRYTAILHRWPLRFKASEYTRSINNKLQMGCFNSSLQLNPNFSYY